MAKDDEAGEPKAKFSFEEELKAERRKTIDLEASVASKDSKIDTLQAEVRKLRKDTAAESRPKDEVVEQKKEEPSSPPAPEPKHAMSITDQFCPTCGELNAEWKDETKCADCGHDLGAIATLSKVKKCPGCGHTESSKTPDEKLAVLKPGVKVPAKEIAA
jgi:predicted RNA-binding Zn-ribbon protein involved in translation (DUF1610 family)